MKGNLEISTGHQVRLSCIRHVAWVKLLLSVLLTCNKEDIIDFVAILCKAGWHHRHMLWETEQRYHQYSNLKDFVFFI